MPHLQIRRTKNNYTIFLSWKRHGDGKNDDDEGRRNAVVQRIRPPKGVGHLGLIHVGEPLWHGTNMYRFIRMRSHLISFIFHSANAGHIIAL